MRHMLLVLAAVSVLASSAANHVQAQRPNPAQIDVRRLMSAREFKAAGLDKLSAREIQALNKWLGKFALQIRQAAPSGGGGCASVIESQIDGKFEGWDGETVFRLANGQIWQQAEYAYMYHYAYRPEVTIFPSSSGCKMKVEGVSDSILVKRLR